MGHNDHTIHVTRAWGPFRSNVGRHRPGRLTSCASACEAPNAEQRRDVARRRELADLADLCEARGHPGAGACRIWLLGRMCSDGSLSEISGGMSAPYGKLSMELGHPVRESRSLGRPQRSPGQAAARGCVRRRCLLNLFMGRTHVLPTKQVSGTCLKPPPKSSREGGLHLDSEHVRPMHRDDRGAAQTDDASDNTGRPWGGGSRPASAHQLTLKMPPKPL